MNPYLQEILHNITTRLAALEDKQEKKEWVGLTDDEIKKVNQLGIYEKPLIEFAKAIEAKLKEKNAKT
jgi:hypothetical protein